MQANRPNPRSAARIALLAALALGFATAVVQAQDTTHVLPADSSGYINRARYGQFLQNLQSVAPLPLLQAPWQRPFGAQFGAQATTTFDTAVARAAADLEAAQAAERMRRHLQSFALDTGRSEQRRGLFGLSPNTADVTFDGSLQFQISTTRQRNEACTPALVQTPGSGCTGGFSAPVIDNVVQLTSSGVFAQRFHVNIDFDSKRDYAAGNIIQGYYQGLTDEKLQRVNIGTVTFIPPPSRFLAASIPTNNFGISAEMVFGPVRIDGIVATQKGSMVNSKTFTVGGSGSVEPQDQLKRDLDYEPDRMFWVVDPTTLPGYPAVDILNAGSIPVQEQNRPVEVRIYRYVAANQASGANANYDGITASGVNGIERVGAIRWRLLKPNIDYWLDPSGLWFTLTGRIDPNDYLAVSYRTTDNAHIIGTLPSTDNPAARDSVQLIYLPNRGPASPVFPYEMRQVYHISGSSLVRSSLKAAILVANSQRPASAPGTYLSVLGLAIPSDQALLDIDNRVFPRVRDAGASQVIKDAFLVFPSAQPFDDPQLTPMERNDSLYRTPEYLLFTQGPPSTFQIHLQFDAQGGADRSSVSLDALQITEGSENVQVNGVKRVKGIDYTIDYATGRIQFLDPQSLFGNGTATVVVTYEQRGLFAQAPTSLAGVTATWTLGANKHISFAGLYQAEEAGYTRPKIGFEPKASLLAGLTGDFLFNTPALTRWLNHLVKKPLTAPSSLTLTGELAMSAPNPNESGDAYLEEFENDGSIALLASENAWHYGSVPQSTAGVENIMGQRFDTATAVQLIWQNLVPGQADSIVQYSPHDIDPTIALVPSTTPPIEPVLWMMLHADTAGGIVDFQRRSHWTQPHSGTPGGPPANSPRFRSMTTPLSPTGTDLSRNDYFEFAFYQDDTHPVATSGMKIVVDLGKVSEDALAIAPASFSVIQPGVQLPGTSFTVGDTVFSGRQYVGRGRLDTEKSAFGTWNAVTDDNGILADRPDTLINSLTGVPLVNHALCADSLSGTIFFYPWGDLGARCSNHNGVADTEDLDGDNLLDAQGSNDDVFRYVVDLHADSTKYFVRSHTITDNAGHSATWTIYRVPLHTPNDTIGSPDIHLIKQMRLTFVTPPPPGGGDEQPVRFAMALMKFTGAAWIARAPSPIASLSGATAQTHGTVIIGTVSTQDSIELGYTSPPGIGNASSTVSVTQSQFNQQINEKSLRIQVTDLHPGERAEGYTRLVDGTQNLLAYRQVRVWFRGRPLSAGWNNGQVQAYVKVGSDAYNFYLYRSPIRSDSWDPEILIDVQTWQDLKLKIENERLRGPPVVADAITCGGDSTAYVACEGNYMVQARDPQINPPNLSAVQELAAGIYYPGAIGAAGTVQTELWVDDIRVSQPVSSVGYAGAVTAHLIASDVAVFDFSGVYQDGNFHLMGQVPSYQNVASMVTSTTLHLEKFLSPRFGFLIPVSISSSWGWTNPTLISGSDVIASGLDGLRRPRNDATTWTVAFRDPYRPKSARLTRLVLNPLSFTAAGSITTTITSLSDASSSNWSATLAYTPTLQRRLLAMHLKGLVQGLPRWLRESTGGQGLSKATFAPWPTSLQLSSSLTHTMGDLQSFLVPIQTLADTILKPVTSEQYLWRNSAGLTLQPFSMLTFSSNWSSTRDLRQYDDTTTRGRVVNAAHKELLGTDVGVERDRSLTNSLGIAPRISSWWSPQVNIGTNFILSRSLATRNPVRVEGDTAGAYILPQTLDNSRFIEFRMTVDPRALSRRLFGDSSKVTHAFINFRPIELIQRHTLESTFDLATFSPNLGYQLALGGLGAFLSHGGQQAIGATDATSRSVTASVDLPAGFNAQLGYIETETDRYQQNASATGFLETTGQTESWPSGRVSWSRSFAKGPLANITTESQIQRDQSTSESPFADGTFSTAVSDNERITPGLTLVFRNGMLARANGEIDHSTASFTGNVTKTQALNLVQTLSWSVRMPRFVSATRRTLQIDLQVSENNNNSCIQRTADSACVTSYDLERFEVHTGFSALMQHALRAGVTFGYVHNAVTSQGLVYSTITLAALLSIPLSALGM